MSSLRFRLPSLNGSLQAFAWMTLGAGILFGGFMEARGAVVASWTFDGNAGTATPATVTDFSGNLNDLALGGAAAYSADTPFAYAGNTSLDVTSAVNSNDRAGNDALTVGQFANNATWSVSAWFKTSATGSTQQIVSQRKASTGNGWMVALSSSGIPFFQVQGQSGGDARVAIGTNNLANGLWHHVVAVSDPNSALDANGDGELLLYLDGVLTDTDIKVQPNAIDYGNSVLAVGAGRDLSAGGYNGFNGYVDEAVLYNHALSASEVVTLYANSIVPEPASAGILFLAGVTGLSAICRRQKR